MGTYLWVLHELIPTRWHGIPRRVTYLMGTYLWLLHKLGNLPVGIDYQAWALICGYCMNWYLPVSIHNQAWAFTCGYDINYYLPVGMEYQA
ncbi:hypothetical protein XELAEV_18046274mg [Xenopus laevis]|uniref:Uncharacterized protein n=1 Tax=Xenopus laevis TaxID=8355 RepID=A0A974H0F5_XENLA|nr:hypothetical protein XELAEV_18046274mg [Xenopus laevis]